MSKADDLFISMCRDIIENGRSTEGHKVRPKWDDGTPAHTIRRFSVINQYDLQEEFPAITLRKTAIKSAMDEILWIWQRKSNNINDLKPHIWDEWADENGSIGKAYGYQMGIKYYWSDITSEGLEKMYGKDWQSKVYGLKGGIIVDIPSDRTFFKEAFKEPVVCAHRLSDLTYKYYYMDQVDKVIYDLINNPFSRRILTSIFDFQDLPRMNLQPCVWSVTFNVSEDDKGLILNTIVNQRSQDILAANNWNTVQYALLQMMLAQVTGMRAGKMIHVISDAHIYDRHVPMVKELITRKTYPAPKVTLNPNIKDFYQFTTDDITIKDYETGPQIKNIPIAI